MTDDERAAILRFLDPEDGPTVMRVKAWLCENRHLHLINDDVRNVIAGLRAIIGQGETVG